MTARLVALLLCPALFSCSVWMKLDKDALDYSDEHVDIEEDFMEDGAPDIPGDFSWDGPCPDAPECWGHDDCFDDNPCTTDFCYMECGACVNTPIDGAVVYKEAANLDSRREMSESPPQVAWTGTEFGVVWGHSFGVGSSELFFAAVSADGNDFTYPPLRLTDDFQEDKRPRITWTGSRWAVAWIHYPGAGGQVHLSLITPGSLDHLAPTLLFETPGHMAGVDIVMSADKLGVAYDSSDTGQYTMMFSLLELDGTPIGTPATVDRQDSFMLYPSLAWSGTQFGLVWQDERRGSPTWDIYFAWIDAGGMTTGTPVPVVSTPHLNERPSLAWSGTSYGVAYHKRTESESPEIYFIGVPADGGSPGPENKLTGSDETHNNYPDLTFTGSEYGLLYNSEMELSLIRLYSDGTRVTDDAWVNTYDVPAQLAGSIVWNDSEYAVAWQGEAGDLFNLLEICAP